MGTTMLGGHVVCQTVTVSPTVAQVEAVDTVLASIDVPGDAIMLDVILTVTDMDTGATLAIDVGDTSDDNRFIAAFSGQAAGSIRASDSAGLLEGIYQYSVTGEATVEATVQAAATTGAAGTLTLTVVYSRQ